MAQHSTIFTTFLTFSLVSSLIKSYMITSLKTLIRKVKLLSPISTNMVILIGVMYISFVFYKKFATLDNQFQPIIFAMCKIAILLILLVIVFSLVSVMIAYLFFKKQITQNNKNFQIQFSNTTIKNANMGISISMQKIIIPFMGFIKTVLLYDKTKYTPILNVSSSATQHGFFIKQLEVQIPLRLADIKEYQIQKGYLFFEDMLRLFSIPMRYDCNQTFQNQPILSDENNTESIPKQTNELTIRIPQMRRIDGDLLHYKKFSTSDDTRRIVWKIFAKNRELVVRTPEIFNPFASNIVMYASFYNGQNLITESVITAQLLNYYKDAVFTIYDVLQKKDFAVNYISDQALVETNKIIEKITLSNWQTTKPIHQYVVPKKATIICIHSLTSISDLQNINQEIDKDTIVYFIKTSNVFSQNILWKTLSRIFVMPPKDELESIRNKWWLSSTKQLVQKNEKELEAFLQKQNYTFTIL